MNTTFLMITLSVVFLLIIIVGYLWYSYRQQQIYLNCTQLPRNVTEQQRELSLGYITAQFYGWDPTNIDIASEILQSTETQYLAQLTVMDHPEEYLLQRYLNGDRIYFSYALYSIMSNKDLSNTPLRDHEGLPLLPEVLRCYVFNLKRAIPTLKKYGITITDNANDVILGWDMAELIIETRYFLAKNLIDASFANDFIHQAYSAVIARQKNWHDFSKSYLIGLAMLTGNSERLQHAMQLSQVLLRDKNAFWAAHPLQ